MDVRIDNLKGGEDMMGWKELCQAYPHILDSLWLFDRRGEGGDGKFHGNFIPQVPSQLIERYTDEGDIVWDPFAGSGTSRDVGWQRERIVLASDLVSMRDDIWEADARTAVPVQKRDNVTYAVRSDVGQLEEGDTPVPCQLTILHPPYHDIVQFNPDNPQDLSNCPSVADFLEQMWIVAQNVDQYVAPKGWVALVCGDIYKDGQVVPLGFLLMQHWRTRLSYQLKNIIVKNICGNEHNAKNTNLWYWRHRKYGTSKFAHEMIFVFRKTK